MHLIEDRIREIYPLKEKKITKPKTNSIRDIFDYFCKPKIEKGYKVKRNTLLRPLAEVKKNIEDKLKAERERFIELKRLKEDNYFSSKLEEDIIVSSAKIKTLLREQESLEYDFADVKKIISYEDFREIIKLNNKFITDEIIKGKAYTISYRLGFIEARMIERNYTTKSVDFGATNKKKKELLESGVTVEELYNKETNPNGIKYIKYRLDKDYARISWNKGGTSNISVYTFSPSVNNKDKTGFKNRFSIANIENPSLKRRYPKIIYSKDDI